MSTLRFVAPSARHVSLIRGYWCVEDWSGVHVGKPIITGPSAGSIVTVNVGLPNADAEGRPGPQVALSGLYTQVHQWQSCAETCFIMVMLSAQGLACLFPGFGRVSVDRVLDVRELLGNSVARQLELSVGIEQVVHGQVEQIERWIDRRLELRRSLQREESMQSAIRCLAGGESIDRVSKAVQVSRRTLYEWSVEHLGIGPKALSMLARLERSIAAVQSGKGDPICGYSDQAHQIRDWRRHLCQTPTRYRTQKQSHLAIEYRQATVDALHAGTLYL